MNHPITAPRERLWNWLLVTLPLLAVLGVWLTPLSFVPVPWPDDSAFYFVGKDLFHWPPRWVMTSQAPFEPTYRIWNFNTMPLLPILIGLGRFIGIDGSFALKFWSLLPWGLSGSLLVFSLRRARLPIGLSALVALAFASDPALRWGSVLIRPEPMIGLFGMALVLGLTFGFPARLEARGRFRDPIALLLALAAYAHFNAVHLLFPVCITFALALRWKRLVEIALESALYLTPWFLTILAHPVIFTLQMKTQWARLAVPNDWLSSIDHALNSLFQSLGSPEPWPSVLKIASIPLWALIFLSIVAGLAIPIGRKLLARAQAPSDATPELSLVPSAAWVLGTLWLWHTKPEVWFTYYIHLALWTFLGVALVRLRDRWRLARAGLALIAAVCAAMFLWVDLSQALRLGATSSWHWSIYRDFITCIDGQLSELDRKLGGRRPFRVWDPTFPDITIELSRRHPDWEFTRTSDFWERRQLAIKHAHEVEAVVVPETINWAERNLSGPMSEHPEIQSTWLTWKDYLLYPLWSDPSWKPSNRYLCQRGRWQAFIFPAR